MKKIFLAAMSWLLLSTTALAQDAGQTANVQLAMQSFERAAAGDKDAVEEAVARFKALGESQAQSPWYKARLGSLTTMQARDAWAPWKKMGYTEKGLDLIDEALGALAPEHDGKALGNNFVGLDVRYTAAVTFSSIPKFFNRWAQAERLFKEITQQAEFANTSKAFQAQVWLGRAQLAKQREQRELYTQWLRKAADLAPASEAGKQARTLLLGRAGQ